MSDTNKDTCPDLIYVPTIIEGAETGGIAPVIGGSSGIEDTDGLIIGGDEFSKTWGG